MGFVVRKCIHEADLEGANLEGADLDGSVLTGTNTSETQAGRMRISALAFVLGAPCHAFAGPSHEF
jgi:uncharacterized protein YjbI with pentapeptide repeats